MHGYLLFGANEKDETIGFEVIEVSEDRASNKSCAADEKDEGSIVDVRHVVACVCDCDDESQEVNHVTIVI